MNKYVIFIVLVICQYIMDRSINSCYHISGELLLIFHHFFAIYLYLGSFFFDPFIHLIVATLTIIHWYTYGKCILTEYTNIFKIFPKIHWILLFTLIVYDLCLIID